MQILTDILTQNNKKVSIKSNTITKKSIQSKSTLEKSHFAIKINFALKLKYNY